MATPGQDRVAGMDTAGAAAEERQAGLWKIEAEWGHLGPSAHPILTALGPLPLVLAGPGDWEIGCQGQKSPDQVPRSHHHQDLQSPGARLAIGPGFEAQLVGRPRGQEAQKAPPHYFPSCRYYCPYQGPPRAAGGSGVMGYGWYHGVHGMKAEGQDQGNGPGLDCGYGVSWTCQDWGCGTWVQAAPECCHPHPPSWCPRCLCCCWLTPR